MLEIAGMPECGGRCCNLKAVMASSLFLQESVMLAPFTTLGIGGPARYFCEASSEAEVEQAAVFALDRGLRLFVLGGGSNVLVSDAGFDGVVVRVAILGLKQEGGDDGRVFVKAGAGEDWNGLVLYAVEREYAGMECLAGIPGDVGGTPVQNVGAYGQEVAETVVKVRAFDLMSRVFVELDHAACGFGYRRSVFNLEARGRYVVTAVTYALRPGGEPALRYADLSRYFAGTLEAGERPTLRQVYDAVRSIREGKGMLAGQGGADGRSVGSFFKNPVVTVDAVARVAVSAGCNPDEVPRHAAAEDRVKLPAAWLVERAGFRKGFGMGRAAISSRHTLALVNLGGATFAEVIALRDAVVEGVEARFGIRLEQEPVVVGGLRDLPRG